MSKTLQDYRKEIPELEIGLNVPKHIAIVMDGNGRWAKKQDLSVIEGHKAGAEALRKLLCVVEKWNIKYLTVFAFSTENWHREKSEVEALMALIKYHLEDCLEDLLENNIRFKVIGDISKIDLGLQEKIKEIVEKTKNNSRATLIVALNYGARQEILMAAQKLVDKMKQEEYEGKNITEKDFSALLYTANIPDPDLFIRSSGECRMSNFLLWQSAYTELFFTPTLWPDFDYTDLLKALKSYNKRERRYGKRGV